jgi:hypothetical protein
VNRKGSAQQGIRLPDQTQHDKLTGFSHGIGLGTAHSDFITGTADLFIPKNFGLMLKHKISLWIAY